MYIYPNANLSEITRTSHLVFKYVETQFEKWLAQSNPANEYREQYFGEPEFGGGCADRKGAIQDAIETASNEANESGKPVNMSKFDYDAIFAL